MSHRFHDVLGAGIDPFFRILGGQVFLGSLFGGNSLARFAPRAAVAIGLFGIALAGFSFLTECRELRALQVFAALVLGATLARPIAMTPPGSTAWEAMAKASELHYWFLPCLAVVWSLAYAARSRYQFFRIIAVPLLGFMAIGVVRDFRRAPRNDFQFALHARQFEQAPRGAIVDIPIYPNGFKTTLVKH